MTNLDNILKSRDITLSTKVHLVKAMVFPVVVYGCESWTIKRAECRRIDAFELWCWRRLLRVPWTTRRSNLKVILNIHWKDWCCSWNSNTLVSWWKEPTHLKSPWCWERLKVGGEGDSRGWDGWMASPTQWTWVWVNSRSWLWTGRPGMLQSMRSQRVGHNWVTELNWWDFLGLSVVKNLPASAVATGDRVGSLDLEDPQEKEMGTYSSIVANIISWPLEPGDLQSMRSQRVQQDWTTECTHTHTYKHIWCTTKKKGIFEWTKKIYI